MTLLAYAVLIGLAAFRLYRIFARDTITERPREWLYDRSGAVSEFLADLMSCPWCIGFWYAGGLAALVTRHEGYAWPEFALLWLAGSAACGLVAKIEERID